MGRAKYIVTASFFAVGVLLTSDGLANWLPKWLQLPLDQGWATLLAGLLALGAGALAYRGAMASVKQERERAHQEDQCRRLNLYLKAEHMAYNLLELSSLGQFAARLTFSFVTPEGRDIPGTIPSAEVYIPRPVQLDELWNNLADFPGDAIHEIRLITREFDAVEEYMRTEKEIRGGSKSPIAARYHRIRESAYVLGAIMNRHTQEHCKEMEERASFLYGDPNDDDFFD